MSYRLRAHLIAAALVLGSAARVAAVPPPPAPPDPDVDLVDEQPPAASHDLWYGAAARLRWVSVPRWLLNEFTKNNVPLSSWSTGVELFRRKGNFDFAVAFNYVNLSPADGNWLGSSSDPTSTVNFVHFDHFGMYAFDASFIWHTFFNSWFGLRYGAGFGLGILTGHIQRTVLADNQCNAQNAGDTSVCKPTANETAFQSGSVPPAVPILNVDLGVDFRIPRVKGLEIRLDGGFYDTFFLGGGVGYAF
ncbi:MAG TPA: hypothetical protein VN962_04465 [Polyangia bacterium]|nr:hypothetical protein [Polyangia bacterium]